MKMLVPIILTKEMNKYVYIIGGPDYILFKFSNEKNKGHKISKEN